jgi:hypothetical protein
LEAARLEFNKRPHRDEEFAEIMQMAHEVQNTDSERARLPLSAPLGILLMVLPFPLVHLVLAEAHYRRNGYTRRADEVWMCALFSIIGLVLLRILI